MPAEQSREHPLIRTVKKADRKALTIFFASNNTADTIRYFHPFPLTEETAASIACEPHKDRYYIAVRGHEIVAFAMLRGWEEGYEVPSLGLLVDSRWRRRGMGSVLVRHAIDEAECVGCRQVRLSVEADNEPALRLYSAFGFREIGRNPSKMSQGVESIVMIKDLSKEVSPCRPCNG